MNKFGLHVGNSTVSIALVKDGKAEVLANEAGERVTAAVVTINSDEQVVGSAAGVTSYSLAPRTVRNIKTLLDSTTDSVDLYNKTSLVKYTPGTGFTIPLPDRKPLVFTPHQILTLIFKKLYGIGAGAAPGQKHLSCVLSVPVDWSDADRLKFRDAATDAGWNVLQVVNEPAAALLAYSIGFDSDTENTKALVFRLGGVSCESTVFSIDSGFYRILSHVHAPTGGSTIVTSLTNHLCDEFKRKYHLDPNESRKSLWKMTTGAVSLLHSLSTLPSSSRFIESVIESVDFNPTLSLARLESLISPLLPQFIGVIRESLSQAGLEVSDVKHVVLSGGALKIPKIRSAVSALFDGEIHCSLSPDEVLAVGSAVQANLIASSHFPSLDAAVDLPFLDSSIEIDVNTETVTLPKGSPVPISERVLVPNSDLLKINARIGSGHVGEATLEFSEIGDLDVHLQATMENLLVIEAVNGISNEFQKSIVRFSPLVQ